MIRAVHSPGIGIAAIGVYEPPWLLGNDWFADLLSRKFVPHTGILSRHIATEDEVTIGLRAVEGLRREVRCDLWDCAAVVFVSPSLVQQSVARKYLDEQSLRLESARRAARQFARRLGISAVPCYGINWGCSGYSKALALVRRQILPALYLERDEFILVVTASRISRITDYACKQTAPLFGDLGTATLLAPLASEKYPVHFALVAAEARMEASDGVFFDYHVREHVVVPTPGGGKSYAPRRLVFSLDGMGIGDAAPRAMAAATVEALGNAGIRPEDVRFLVPHQAGTGIVRLATMKLQEAGVSGEVINGLTSDVANVSSGSVPYGLRKTWNRLEGMIACPTAGVGTPGDAKVSQGCILLRGTETHRRTREQAASSRADAGDYGVRS